MTLPTRSTPAHVLRRKAEVLSILDEICQDLELTQTQLESARTSYEAVGKWLAGADHPILQDIEVYSHGSTALGTTVRPLGREDFDVDLICLVYGYGADRSPAELKALIGQRLREHARYAKILEEKKRCWRLNYEREFHLDVSPTIINIRCTNGGELVPDKKLRQWRPTNPRGYRALFEQRAGLEPRFYLEKAYAEDRAHIAPFPATMRIKGILRRIVQLLKRHRDIYFLAVVEDVAPISILLTTLAARAYERCVQTMTFESELDLLIETIRMMPRFIEVRQIDGKTVYAVPNETTLGENFAERWNTEPARTEAFYAWHARALSDFTQIASLEGMDLLTEQLEKGLGQANVRRVMDARTGQITRARAAGKLFVAPAVGLTLTESAQAVPVPKNTHYGD